MKELTARIGRRGRKTKYDKWYNESIYKFLLNHHHWKQLVFSSDLLRYN